jgi:hypothetical protein
VVSKFRERVETAIRIVRQEREVSATRLAYMMDVAYQTALVVLKAAAEIDGHIEYKDGVARWVGNEIPVSELPFLTEADLAGGGEGGAQHREGEEK